MTDDKRDDLDRADAWVRRMGELDVLTGAYVPALRVYLAGLLGDVRAEARAQQCEAETSTRWDGEYRTYRCLLPAGHVDAHQGEPTVEWTDETYVPRPEPTTDDERLLTTAWYLIDEWQRRGDNAGHAAGHLRGLLRAEAREEALREAEACCRAEAEDWRSGGSSEYGQQGARDCADRIARLREGGE